MVESAAEFKQRRNGVIDADSPEVHGQVGIGSELGIYPKDVAEDKEEETKTTEDRNGGKRSKKTVSISYSQELINKELQGNTTGNGGTDQEELSSAFDSLSDLSSSVRHANDRHDPVGNSRMKQRLRDWKKSKQTYKEERKEEKEGISENGDIAFSGNSETMGVKDYDEEAQQSPSIPSQPQSKIHTGDMTAQSSLSGSKKRHKKKKKKKKKTTSQWEASVAADDTSSVAGQSTESSSYYEIRDTSNRISCGSIHSSDSPLGDDSRNKLSANSLTFRMLKEKRNNNIRRTFDEPKSSSINISSNHSTSSEGSDLSSEVQKLPNRTELRKDLQAQVTARFENPSNVEEENGLSDIVRQSINRNIRRLASLKEIEDERETENKEGGDDDEEAGDGGGNNESTDEGNENSTGRDKW
eukprot:CAMPEP_0172364568 /NCGR_PEP_ID=MMETSP1060-20121228/7651_1 /TAXON_ID=37318 /ORGANISM="Pseudo-nitzschia pungens, Strain cf. cingulata" /LENGTH=412 /DNA_ID=CAMNT_0013087593 /DNA_START=96 /DNA_END=1331 /DNA_ORIENTATION=+